MPRGRKKTSSSARDKNYALSPSHSTRSRRRASSLPEDSNTSEARAPPMVTKSNKRRGATASNKVARKKIVDEDRKRERSEVESSSQPVVKRPKPFDSSDENNTESSSEDEMYIFGEDSDAITNVPSESIILLEKPPNIPKSSLKLARILTIYTKLHPMTEIPKDMIILKDDTNWPPDLREVALGKLLAATRTRYAEEKMSSEEIVLLEKHGIVWSSAREKSPPSPILHNPDESAEFGEILSMYNDVYGTTAIPQDFVIPINSMHWPDELRGAQIGLRLQSTLNHYHDKNMSMDDIALLESHGIVWGEKAAPALELFTDANSFNDKTEHRTRSKDKQKKQECIDLTDDSQSGFDFPVSSDKTKHPLTITIESEESLDSTVDPKKCSKICRMMAKILSIYMELHDTAQIPCAAIVSNDDTDWPSHLRGVRIGHRLNNMRSKYKNKQLSQNEIKFLEDCGIHWKSEKKSTLVPIPDESEEFGGVLLIYLDLYGDTEIPEDFIVSKIRSKDWPWDLQGSPIGMRLKSIRDRYHKKQMRANEIKYLQGHGIVWGKESRSSYSSSKAK